MFGIAAIGTEQGHCFLVDLRLDDDHEEFDEWHRSKIEVLDHPIQDLAQVRYEARLNGTHVGIEFGSKFLIVDSSL